MKEGVTKTTLVDRQANQLQKHASLLQQVRFASTEKVKSINEIDTKNSVSGIRWNNLMNSHIRGKHILINCGLHFVMYLMNF